MASRKHKSQANLLGYLSGSKKPLLESQTQLDSDQSTVLGEILGNHGDSLDLADEGTSIDSEVPSPTTQCPTISESCDTDSDAQLIESQPASSCDDICCSDYSIPFQPFNNKALIRSLSKILLQRGLKNIIG